jgi:hypothetical protein
MSFFKKPDAPPPPPSTPTRADASVLEAGKQASQGFSSLVSSGAATGLKRKASTVKPSLIGSTSTGA